MEIGFHFVNFDVPGGVQALPTTLAAAAKAAEQAGASWFTMADHFFQMDNLWPAEAPMLEIYSCLGYLAGQTERIKLVVLVNGVTYHYPGLLAKTATTLDVLSGGRLVFGLGAAWYERECVGLGVPFPPLSERYERLEETLQICRQMWSSDNGRYDGKYYQLAETLCSPQPIQRPNPPVLARAVPASAKRCVSSRSTPTRGTAASKPSKKQPTRSTCSTGIATQSAAIPARFKRPQS